MRLTLALTPVLFAALNGWVKVEVHSVQTAVKFSPIFGDQTVTSTYVITVLEDEISSEMEEIDSFRIEIILKSGYTITRVLKNWERITIASASGTVEMEALELKVMIEGWDYWDLEVFKTNVWYRVKSEEG